MALHKNEIINKLAPIQQHLSKIQSSNDISASAGGYEKAIRLRENVQKHGFKTFTEDPEQEDVIKNQKNKKDTDSELKSIQKYDKKGDKIQTIKKGGSKEIELKAYGDQIKQKIDKSLGKHRSMQAIEINQNDSLRDQNDQQTDKQSLNVDRIDCQSQAVSGFNNKSQFSEQKTSPDQDEVISGSDKLSIEQRREYRLRIEEMDKERLYIARYWLLISVTYFIIRASVVTLPRWELLEYNYQVMLIIQVVIAILILLGIAFSYTNFRNSLEPIKILLFLQAVQMIMGNFNVYLTVESSNSIGLNMLATQFSVMFCFFDVMLLCIIVKSFLAQVLSVLFIFGGLEGTLIITNFDFQEMSGTTKIALSISVIYTAILIPVFCFVCNLIMIQSMNEAKAIFKQKDQFTHMFNGLQEGVIVIDGVTKVTFMNDLANKIFSEICNMHNFFRGKRTKDSKESSSAEEMFNKKIFYQYIGAGQSQNGSKEKIFTKKKMSKGKSTDESRYSSDPNQKSDFSIKEILEMDATDLSSRIFSFERDIGNKSRKTKRNKLTKDQKQKIFEIIKNMPSMQGIDESSLPRFNYFQIKRSHIVTPGEDIENNQQQMICIIDVSQRIMYDNSKAEGELLSLINSTISHEMRNPLNSIINQCRIFQILISQFRAAIDRIEKFIKPYDANEFTQLHLQFKKGNIILTSSSNMLLLNVEDILGYAQLKAGKFVKGLKPFNVHRAVQEIVQIQQYQAESKQVAISTELIGFPLKQYQNMISSYSKSYLGSSSGYGSSELQNDINKKIIQDLNLIIETDEKRMKQVLMNLLSNALKFTKNGGKIKIKIELVLGVKDEVEQSKMIKLRKKNLTIYRDSFSSNDNNDEEEDDLSNSLGSDSDKKHQLDCVYDPAILRNKLVISVEDTGIGIKKKDQKKLFKLFGCLQNTRQMNTQGIGLGLVICENIVKAFNGQIGVKSRFGRGSKFCFSFLLGKDNDFIDIMQLDKIIEAPSQMSVQTFSVATSSQKAGTKSLESKENVSIQKSFGRVESVEESQETGKIVQKMVGIQEKVFKNNKDQYQKDLKLQSFQQNAKKFYQLQNITTNKQIEESNFNYPKTAQDDRTTTEQMKQNNKIDYNYLRNSTEKRLSEKQIDLSLQGGTDSKQTLTTIFNKNKLGGQSLAYVSKILIVDDEKFNCDIIDGFLMILGFQNRHQKTVYAYNGEQAVEQISQALNESDPFRFSLILMDCNMPFLDGYEATKRIRSLFNQMEIPRQSQPKIIAITGHVENEYIQKAIQSGMDKVYPKPLPIQEFGQLLLNMKLIDKVPPHLRLDSDANNE